uniref:Uncharacterized protein n=1 Tax=Panagrolaimus davidi TaxID=227884 RepID=A0A914PV62_9BILA
MIHNENISFALNFDRNTFVFVNSKFGFTLVPKCLNDKIYQFHFEKIIGKFEVTKIALDKEFLTEIPFDSGSNTFKCEKGNKPTLEIFMSAKIVMKKADYVEAFYHLQICPKEMIILEIYDYIQRVLEIPEYKLQFNYYIKRIAEENVEIAFDNHEGVRIQYHIGKFKFYVRPTQVADYKLSLIFERPIKSEFESAESRPNSSLSSQTSVKAVKELEEQADIQYTNITHISSSDDNASIQSSTNSEILHQNFMKFEATQESPKFDTQPSEVDQFIQTSQKFLDEVFDMLKVGIFGAEPENA